MANKINDNNNNIAKTRYTHRDYETIKKDLIDLIPSLTSEWTSREESDPGIVLIKLMSTVCDNLSFNMDKMALELYLASVTQRKNCAKILQLLGYKMHWFRSATLTAYLRKRSSEETNCVLVPFQSTLHAGDIVYSFVPDPNVTSYNDMFNPATVSSDINATAVLLVEGACREVTFTEDELTDNRFYLNESNIDENHIYLTYSTQKAFLIESLAKIEDNESMYFEFNVDEYDTPYIQLCDDWRYFFNSSNSENFVLRYVLTSGSAGNITSNSLDNIVISPAEGSNNKVVVTHYGTIVDTSSSTVNSGNTEGKDPDTVEEARDDAYKYVHTFDTLVTAHDFEKAALRAPNIDAALVVDKQIILNWVGQNKNDAALIAQDLYNREGASSSLIDGQMPPYAGITYVSYDNFNLRNAYWSDNPASEEVKTKYNMYDADDSDFLCGEDLPDLGYFPYKPMNYQTTTINGEEGIYSKSKMISLDMDLMGTTRLFPFKVNGTLYLTEPLLPEETLQIVKVIENALADFYQAVNHNYGDKVRFIDVVNVVENAHVKVRYFDADADMIEYSRLCDISKWEKDKTCFAKFIGLSSDFNLDVEYRRFKVKNNSSEPITLTGIIDPKTHSSYMINGNSSDVVTVINLSQMELLNTFVNDNPDLVFLAYK